MTRAWLRVAGAGALTLFLAWAASQALEAMGAQRAANDRLVQQLRDRDKEIAGVLATNAQLADSNTALATVAAQARAREDTLHARAVALEHQADQLRAERAARTPLGTVAPSDSIGYYRDLLEASDREAELLRSALEQRWQELEASNAVAKAHAAQIVVLQAAADSATAALTRVRPVLAGAGQALAHAEPTCRVMRVAPCPSRSFAFVAGGVAAVLAYNAIHQVHR